jgi:DNA-binding NarL/FixJ family response regulator
MTIRVLIADDHQVMREGLRVLLEADSEITVVSAVANGREAVRAVRELSPDVVVIDITMPDMNGIEATRLIRSRCATTQVVVLSMHSSREYVHRAFAAGALGYVLKESASAEVLTAIRHARGGRQYVSSAIALPRGYLHAEDLTKSPLASLSYRERQAMQLVVEGKSSTAIAQIVCLSPKTVETYRSRLMKKLGVADVTALVKFAVEHGLTPSA